MRHPKTQSRLIFALCRLGEFSAAEKEAKEWITEEPNSSEAKKTLGKLALILQTLKDEEQKKKDDLVLSSTYNGNKEKAPIDKHSSPNSLGEYPSIHSSQNLIAMPSNKPIDIFSLGDSGKKNRVNSYCSYCHIMCENGDELKRHCRLEGHPTIGMPVECKDWKFRPPPRGFTAEEYMLCQTYIEGGICRLGQQCSEAHGEEELEEWKERFMYRHLKVQEGRECHLQASYMERLLEKWCQAPNPEKVMKETLDGVSIDVSSELNVTVSCKNTMKEWVFVLNSKNEIQRIALLHDVHRPHFCIGEVSVSVEGKEVVGRSFNQGCQEWENPMSNQCQQNVRFQCWVKVTFRTNIFGTFRQTVVFDFGSEPVLIQRLCVDVIPVANLEKLEQVKDTAICYSERWNSTNAILVPFENHPYALSTEDCGLLSFYPAPHTSKFVVTQSVLEPTLTGGNYVSRMHELLYIEEMAQFELISRFNVTAQLKAVACYLLTPHSASMAKYAQNGELYARLAMTLELTVDSPAGRLILTNCNTVLLSPVNKRSEQDGEKRKVYEAIIEDKGKKAIYLRLSRQCVEELKLHNDDDFRAEVQFQLNRLPLCEMHYAVDKLHPVCLVFPVIEPIPAIPWSPQRQWSDKLDSKLNPKQKEAVLAITASLEMKLPPVLIIGPFGTGKTYTLAQAVKEIVTQLGTRVLVCTHSNSAADIYIKEYLHPYVTDGHPEATPLRIYYRHRWVATVHPTVLQYCLLGDVEHGSNFVAPTLEDIEKHRVVVTTLSMSRCLLQLGLEKGYFTHVLIDEAAQAMECEVIMPLALAGQNTRIVLAGDHMQLNPEVYSPFTQERNLHCSLLERLYDLFPVSFTCKILLCENYRSHEAIVQFTSELFYENHLVASRKQSIHDVFYPLTFFTAQGEDVQDINSTAFYNNAEVYEVVERVIELQKTWPESWGPLDENSIGVVSPYYDQVMRIRAELRKKRLSRVSVERVLNVQGKQFRAIILSTVRTHHTCKPGSKGMATEDLDYGFLSNAKLLNTAVTRAQSLVAVVGDPVSLCAVGKCRKLWEKFINICQDNNSLYGITWDSLRAQLDGMELKKNYVLNPAAPEFIPSQFRNRLSQLAQPLCSSPLYSTSPWPLPTGTPLPPVFGPQGCSAPVLLPWPVAMNGPGPFLYNGSSTVIDHAWLQPYVGMNSYHPNSWYTGVQYSNPGHGVMPIRSGVRTVVQSGRNWPEGGPQGVEKPERREGPGKGWFQPPVVDNIGAPGGFVNELSACRNPYFSTPYPSYTPSSMVSGFPTLHSGPQKVPASRSLPPGRQVSDHAQMALQQKRNGYDSRNIADLSADKMLVLSKQPLGSRHIAQDQARGDGMCSGLGKPEGKESLDDVLPFWKALSLDLDEQNFEDEVSGEGNWRRTGSDSDFIESQIFFSSTKDPHWSGTTRGDTGSKTCEALESFHREGIEFSGSKLSEEPKGMSKLLPIIRRSARQSSQQNIRMNGEVLSVPKCSREPLPSGNNPWNCNTYVQQQMHREKFVGSRNAIDSDENVPFEDPECKNHQRNLLQSASNRDVETHLLGSALRDQELSRTGFPSRQSSTLAEKSNLQDMERRQMATLQNGFGPCNRVMAPEEFDRNRLGENSHCPLYMRGNQVDSSDSTRNQLLLEIPHSHMSSKFGQSIENMHLQLSMGGSNLRYPMQNHPAVRPDLLVYPKQHHPQVHNQLVHSYQHPSAMDVSLQNSVENQRQMVPGGMTPSCLRQPGYQDTCTNSNGLPVPSSSEGWNNSQYVQMSRKQFVNVGAVPPPPSCQRPSHLQLVTSSPPVLESSQPLTYATVLRMRPAVQSPPQGQNDPTLTRNGHVPSAHDSVRLYTYFN